MLPRQLKDRIARNLRRRNLRAAMKASGYLVAVTALGATNAEAATMIIDGFQEVVSAVPFVSPEAAAGHYFGGAYEGLATVAMGSVDQIQRMGGAIPRAMFHSVEMMSQHASMGIDGVRTGFANMMSRSTELGAIWRSSVGNASSGIAQAEALGSTVLGGLLPSPASLGEAYKGSVLASMVPYSQTVVDALKTLAVRAVEVFGVVKGVVEIYRWTMSSVRKRAVQDPLVIEASDSSALPPPAVTNLTVNITLAGEGAANNAAARLREIAEAPDGAAIMADPERLRDAISRPACPLHQGAGHVEAMRDRAQGLDPRSSSEQLDAVTRRAARSAAGAVEPTRTMSLMDRIPSLPVCSCENMTSLAL